jgi:hypothetical protein
VFVCSEKKSNIQKNIHVGSHFVRLIINNMVVQTDLRIDLWLRAKTYINFENYHFISHSLSAPTRARHVASCP